MFLTKGSNSNILLQVSETIVEKGDELMQEGRELAEVNEQV